MSGFAVDGLSTGLNTTEMIRQLMAIERLPVQRLEATRDRYRAEADAYGSVVSAVAEARSALTGLINASGYRKNTASSSDESLLRVTAGPGASPGALTLRVNQLATSHQLVSGGVSSDTTVVGAGTLTIAAGLSRLGITHVAADAGVSAGAVTVSVTSADADGAVIVVDGHENVVSSADLSTGSVTVSDGAGGTYTLTVAATLTVGDGSVSVVRGTSTTTLRELADLVATTAEGATAQVLNLGGTGSDPWRFLVTATGSGTAGALSVDVAGFSGLSGPLSEVTAAVDAQVQIGTGAAALVATRSTNTINDLVSGVTLELTGADAGTDVTVTVARDVEALVDAVTGAVDALNAVLTRVADLTDYDPESKTAGTLLGSSTLRTLTAGIHSALAAVVGTGDHPTLGSLGITLGTDGLYAVDESTLREAIETDHDGVVSLLARSMTATDSRVRYSTATALTTAGTYAVVVTTAPEKASVRGASFTSLPAEETITVRMNGTEVSYTAAAGSNPTSVANGLTAAFAEAGFGLVATVDTDRVVITTSTYGSGATFDIKTSTTGGTGLDNGAGAGVWSTYTGVDVAGTIGGQAAAGAGNLLTASGGDPEGLRISVDVTPTEVSDAGGSLDLGTVTYSPGVLGSLAAYLDRVRDPDGLLDAAVDGANRRADDTEDRIAAYERRLEQVELRYRRQFTALESLMGALANQRQWLAGQLAGLTATS